MESGFLKGSSGNLPEVFEDMITSYLTSNPCFSSPEMRGEKIQRSGKSQYGDQAIGFVQVKREGEECIVKAKITPEHKISKRAYNVTCVINENEDEQHIVSSNCHDCAASQGGCKHAIAIIYWLHRRTEEKSPTEVTNYWKKSSLAAVKDDKGVTTRNICDSKYVPLPEEGDGVLQDFINKKLYQDTIFGLHVEEKVSIALHDLLSDYKSSLRSLKEATPVAFLLFCREKMTEELCREGFEATLNQSNSPKWHALRYGRITASSFHEVSVCHTDGSLVDRIFGANLKVKTAAMERGKLLEKEVLAKFSEDSMVVVEECGFMTDPDLPIFGASPDGVTENYIIEIKCPAKESTIKNFVIDNCVTPKPYAQMQLQMHLMKKNKGLLIIAEPDFEQSRRYFTMEVEYNKEYVDEMMEKCYDFWCQFVWPYLLK